MTRIEVEGGALDEWGNVSLYWPRVDAARVRAIRTMENIVRRGTKAYEGWSNFQNYFIGYLGEEVVSVEMLARHIEHWRELRDDGRSGDVDITTIEPTLRVEVKCARNPNRKEFNIGKSRKMGWDCLVQVINCGQLPEDGYYRCAAWTTPTEIRAMPIVDRRGAPCYSAKLETIGQMPEFWSRF